MADSSQLDSRIALALCALMFLVYCSLGLVRHYSLETNGFDLSVFDYALWTTGTGRGTAYVPMFGYSLFAQHAMPTLLLLSPLAMVFGSPVYLIVVQSAFFIVAAYLLFLFARPYVPPGMAFALLLMFLLGRRPYTAATSYFYIESAEPMLVLGVLLAWTHRRMVLYWTLLALALGCKEDVAVYFIMFGLLLALVKREIVLGALTATVASVWLGTALLFWIPHWRAVYALPPANPFLLENYGLERVDGSALAVLLGRVFSSWSAARLFTLASATGFLCFLSPTWLAIVIPGVLVNLTAIPGKGQSGLGGHYSWAILPWMFVAAAFGGSRLSKRNWKWLPVVALIIAVADTPLPRAILRTPWKTLATATEVRSQLQALHLGSVPGELFAQPNLIPHVPVRQLRVRGLDLVPREYAIGDTILLTRIGDLWPFDATGVDARMEQLQADPRFERLSNGPLFAFRRIK
jgi:uncharacterized membrane protein